MKCWYKPSSTDIVDVKTNTTSSLADHGTVLEGVVDTLDRVVLHADKEARAQLRVRCTRVEQCRRCVREVSEGHHVIGLKHPLDVSTVNADSDTHEHVLRALGNTPVELEEV